MKSSNYMLVAIQTWCLLPYRLVACYHACRLVACYHTDLLLFTIQTCCLLPYRLVACYHTDLLLVAIQTPCTGWSNSSLQVGAHYLVLSLWNVPQNENAGNGISCKLYKTKIFLRHPHVPCPHMVPPYQDGPQAHLHGTNPKGDSSQNSFFVKITLRT